MSYKINTTDGTLLADIVDGRIDQTTTDLTLVGRNYAGYGEYLNENFIKLLENFANVQAPSNPLIGQLWFDTSENRLKVYNGSIFKATDTTTVAATQPTMIAGDIWIDSENKQVYFSDGVSDPILAGPIYTRNQLESGWDIASISDIYGVDKVVNRLMIAGAPVAIFSKDTFTAATNASNTALLSGFGTIVKAGINISSSYSDFKFYGFADGTYTLYDSSDNPYTPESFLQTAGNQTITGYLHVKDDQGLIVGDDSDFIIRKLTSDVVLRNQLSGDNLKIQVTSSGAIKDAITIATDRTNIQTGIDGVVTSGVALGFLNNNPQYNFDFNGSMRITGNLVIDGAQTSLDVTNLRVEDKLIELAITNDSTLIDDATADGSGIAVRVSGDDKTILWNNTYNSWDLSCNSNIPTGYAYKIGGADILTSTTLASTVTSANGLTSIGTLTSLNVDQINLNNATISTSAALVINSVDDIIINSNRKITGVGGPDLTDTDDVVATKGYVDNTFSYQNVYLSLDITGINNSQIALILEDLVPASTKVSGVQAFIHCVYYTGTYSYDATDGLTKSFVSVDKNGTENQSVVQDFSFTAQTTQPVTLTVTRSLKLFLVDTGGSWVYDSDLTSSV